MKQRQKEPAYALYPFIHAGVSGTAARGHKPVAWHHDRQVVFRAEYLLNSCEVCAGARKGKFSGSCYVTVPEQHPPAGIPYLPTNIDDFDTDELIDYLRHA